MTSFFPWARLAATKRMKRTVGSARKTQTESLPSVPSVRRTRQAESASQGCAKHTDGAATAVIMTEGDEGGGDARGDGLDEADEADEADEEEATKGKTDEDATDEGDAVAMRASVMVGVVTRESMRFESFFCAAFFRCGFFSLNAAPPL